MLTSTLWAVHPSLKPPGPDHQVRGLHHLPRALARTPPQGPTRPPPAPRPGAPGGHAAARTHRPRRPGRTRLRLRAVVDRGRAGAAVQGRAARADPTGRARAEASRCQAGTDTHASFRLTGPLDAQTSATEQAADARPLCPTGHVAPTPDESATTPATGTTTHWTPCSGCAWSTTPPRRTPRQPRPTPPASPACGTQGRAPRATQASPEPRPQDTRRPTVCMRTIRAPETTDPRRIPKARHAPSTRTRPGRERR